MKINPQKERNNKVRDYVLCWSTAALSKTCRDNAGTV